MKRVCIYTASFGGHDEPPEVHNADCDMICFTDNPELKRETWKIEYRGSDPISITSLTRTSRMRAKWFKMSSFWQFDMKYEHSIWIDAAFWIHSAPGFAEHCLRYLHDGIAFYPHPAEHRSLEQEVAFSVAMPKYDGEPLSNQIAHYRREGLEGGRLYCGGVIARKHTGDVAQLDEDWLRQCENWTSQDQLSLPYVLWKRGMTPGKIPGDIYSNPYIAHLWSGTKK